MIVRRAVAILAADRRSGDKVRIRSVQLAPVRCVIGLHVRACHRRVLHPRRVPCGRGAVRLVREVAKIPVVCRLIPAGRVALYAIGPVGTDGITPCGVGFDFQHSGESLFQHCRVIARPPLAPGRLRFGDNGVAQTAVRGHCRALVFARGDGL